MNFTCMEPHEIISIYRCAKDKEAMIKILADLTCSSKNEMREFLGLEKSEKASDDVKHREKRKLDEEEALKLYNAGYLDTEIAKKLHCGKSTVARWRIANGLKSKWRERHEKKD